MKLWELLKKIFKKDLPEPYDYLPWIKVKEEEKRLARELLKDNKKYVLFSVSSRGRHKIWPEEKFSELINMLNNAYNIIPVLIGMKNEEEIVNTVIKNLNCEYVNLVGKTDLRILCGIIERCNLTISNDNGVAHLSAALDKPTLIIFGATNPKWYYPYNKKSGYIYKGYKCSPCGIKARCRDYRCMKDIKPEEVFEYLNSNFHKYLE